MTKQLIGLIALFAAHVSDRSTLDELHQLVSDSTTWHKAHALFSRIRKKTLWAENSGDQADRCQYLFEEACAKTLYSMTHESAPFDPDSPYWVVPNALSLARRLGISESEITKIVVPAAWG